MHEMNRMLSKWKWVYFFSLFFLSYLEKRVDSLFDVIVYSYECTYQNRNRTLTSYLRYFCVNHEIMDTQNILERGDIQMKANSAHATNEKMTQHTDIHSHLVYVDIIKAALTNPMHYKIQFLTLDWEFWWLKHCFNQTNKGCQCPWICLWKCSIVISSIHLDQLLTCNDYLLYLGFPKVLCSTILKP